MRSFSALCQTKRSVHTSLRRNQRTNVRGGLSVQKMTSQGTLEE